METVTIKEAYENLANAIIVQAMKDYVAHPNMRPSILRFFYSDFYKVLTDMPPETIIKICKERASDGSGVTYNRPNRGFSKWQK